MPQYEHGGWYNGKQWNANTQSFGGVGVINNPEQQGYGQAVSQEVNRQSAAAQGKSWEEFSGYINANQLQGPTNLGLPSGNSGLQGEVEKYNKQLQDVLAKQKEEQSRRLTEAKQTQTQGLEGFKTTATGIRQDIESFSSKLEPGILEDFAASRDATYRLQQLLTEGNELIKQQKEISGSAAVRNPRINRAIEDVASEAGIIQAFISSLDGRITQAHNIINNKMGEIITSRQQELEYYKKVIELAENDIVRLDQDSKRIAQAEITNAETFLNNALEISNVIKSYMADPAKASLMEGVRLNMSIEEINQTIANNAYNKEVRDQTSELTIQGATPVHDPATVPVGQLLSFTDSRGQVHYFKETKSSTGTMSSINYQTPGQKNASVVNNEGKKTAPQEPQFSAPKGTIWTDPITGIRWLSLGSPGWKREGT